MSKFRITESNGVKFYTSGMLSCPHGFSTRHGGVSTPSHLSSLNLGFDRGDDIRAVEKNRRILADAIGYSENRCVSAHQIHSKNIIRISGSDNVSRGFEGDGFVTADTGIALMIKIADCVPLLMYDPDNRVIGAAHAGWRGTVNDIAGECVREMVNFGADAKSIRCAIGPCIHSCCYEVDSGFRDEVIRLRGEEFASRFIYCSDQNGVQYPANHPHADLPEMNRFLLTEAGIQPKNIDVSESCTCCDPDTFYSHRASHGKRGVMAAVIVLK